MDLPLLFHKTKLGKINQWRVWTIGPEIHVEYGEVGGKLQTTSKKAEPKNVGKSNATTPEQQALLEAAAMHKHRLDRKYSLTPEEAEEPVFLPMLAHEFEKSKKKLKYPVDVQVKLDGLRCMAYWDEGEIVLLSRGGKTWNLPHIQKAIAEVLPKNMVMDGEIYLHGLSLQGINRLAKKWREGPDGSIQLKYYLFDIFDPELDTPWKERYWWIAGIISDAGPEIQSVLQTQASTEEQVYEATHHFISLGYEGGIVRTLDAPYELGHRSRNLLKVKLFQDAEFEIVGHYLGTGRHEGCCVWICKTKEGKEFHCYQKGTLDERRELGRTATEYYSKLLKVQFQHLTEDGIPFLPIGLAIRLEEDI